MSTAIRSRRLHGPSHIDLTFLVIVWLHHIYSKMCVLCTKLFDLWVHFSVVRFWPTPSLNLFRHSFVLHVVSCDYTCIDQIIIYFRRLNEQRKERKDIIVCVCVLILTECRNGKNACACEWRTCRTQKQGLMASRRPYTASRANSITSRIASRANNRVTPLHRVRLRS
jgi:hypothetical protein